MNKIRIGSRGSDLALWQANHVKKQLEDLGQDVEIIIIKTQGDRIQHLSFDKLEGKGFFTKEIEDALLANEIDLAVHSHKDLETTPPEKLLIAAVSERENPADILLIRPQAFQDEEHWKLKRNALVGTSSARRKALMKHFRPDIELKDLRGNVPTRIQKLRDGEYDAIVLAAAGVQRLELDLSEFKVFTLPLNEFVPAPAQGVLGLQIREDDNELASLLKCLNNTEVSEAISIERGVLNKLDGGCQLPLGVHCSEQGEIFVAYGRSSENMIHLHLNRAELNNPVEEILAKLR